MSFVDPASDWYFASTSIIINVISYNIGPCYNGTILYLVHFWKLGAPQKVVGQLEQRILFSAELLRIALAVSQVTTDWPGNRADVISVKARKLGYIIPLSTSSIDLKVLYEHVLLRVLLQNIRSTERYKILYLSVERMFCNNTRINTWGAVVQPVA